MSTPDVQDVAPWVARLARVGFAAKAVLYITIGGLAAQAAFGPGGRTTDTDGALRVVHGLTFGRVILVVIAAGLLGYSVWRMVEALTDPDRRGHGAKGLAVRAGIAARGLIHGALGIGALRLANGGAAADSRGAQYWTGFIMEMPAGQLLVWLAAAGVATYGGYQLYRAYVPKLGRNLDLSALSDGTRAWVVRVSRFGIGARGIVFCLIGFFLARAAARHDAWQVGGIQESLEMLERIGRWPFAVVALGLIAYGVYELVNARYRRIRMALG